MASRASLWLAIDQGGHASRALLFDERGRKVAESFAPVATRREGTDIVEHDAGELIDSLRKAVDEACRLAGRTPIAAAGIATQRSSMVCWSRRTGEPLSPVISWQDRRNAGWLSRLESQRDRIRERTGLVLTPHYGASKMRWCLDHLPAVARAAAEGDLAMGPVASFIACRLTEERPLVADPANASRTQLWDPATRDWAPELLHLFGVPPAALPRCVTSRFAYGTLATSAGAVPLAVVTGDQSAVPFAFGPLDPETAYVNAGTGAFAQRAIRDRLPDAPRLLASVVWSDSSGVDYMLEGTVNGAGSALDWFAAKEGIIEGDASLQAAVPLFLNGVAGLGSPFWIPDFEPRFIGAGTPRERWQAVIESIAFLLRVNLDELNRHGPPLRRIVLTGGISSNDAFCRSLADLAGLPVWRSREAEATARGLAALVAGDARGWVAAAGDEFAPAGGGPVTRRYAAWLSAMAASHAKVAAVLRE